MIMCIKEKNNLLIVFNLTHTDMITVGFLCIYWNPARDHADILLLPHKDYYIISHAIS